MSEHDDLAAWVLGAVDAGDAAAVRAHLEECPECQEAVARLTPVVGALALDVDDVPPVTGLRERILSAATRPVVTPYQASVRDRRVVPMPAPRRGAARRAPRPRIPLSAVAAVVTIALLAGLVVGDAFGRASAPAAPPSQVTHFTLAGHGPMQGATATVIDLKSDGIALVTFAGIPAAPPGKVYELWLITSGNRADPAGVFLPDSNGDRLLVVEKPLGAYKLMAVTLEDGPAGVASPTQQPQIYGNIA